MIDFLQNYYFLLLLPVIPVPLVKRKGFGRHLKDKWIYYAIVAIWAVGIFVLYKSPSFLSPTDPKTAQNVYYFLILIGAGIATIISVWRGLQSKQQIDQIEQQMKNSRIESERRIDRFKQQLENTQSEREVARLERQVTRFEKAIDIATDPKSRNRRGSGFRTLRQILSAWGENFDDATEENISILNYLVFHSFKRTMKQEKVFKKLYEDSKKSFGWDQIVSSKSLFDKTHKPDINVPALNLWRGTLNWHMRKWGNSPVPGIYSYETTLTGSYHFMFSGVNLGNLQFFIKSHKGEIIPATQRAVADFKLSCFLLVDMYGATVDYVDFSWSHFYKINYKEKNEGHSEMSCIGANFTEANLIECNFRGADFKGTSFIGITAIEVIFDEANLTDCKFEGADLGGASFVGTNISGSDFRLAKNLTQGQFQTAYWIRPDDTQFLEAVRPKFPSGFPPDFANVLSNHCLDPEE